MLYFIYLHNVPWTKLNLRVILFSGLRGIYCPKRASARVCWAYAWNCSIYWWRTRILSDGLFCLWKTSWLFKKSISVLSQNLLLPLSSSNYISWRIYWIQVVLLSCDNLSIIWKPTKFFLTFHFPRLRILRKLFDNDIHLPFWSFFKNLFQLLSLCIYKNWHLEVKALALPCCIGELHCCLWFSVFYFIASLWFISPNHFTPYLIWLTCY